MRPIIRVENLGKEYHIGGPRASYQTLRESLSEAARRPLHWLRGRRQIMDSTFWALKDVNFEVRPGEVVGIIGRNGAGKSTLLKVLSRITEPTSGQVDLYGRVGSLLEVGTGFHPELTGRENIFLNGAILGMRQKEIERKFDEIVDFSGIEQFLDTPVKRYSSGMYVRLAFAVAASLEQEILFVDEVLAVGDAEFQKKCLGKMGEVAKGGRTVLFVSHNMEAVQRLCTQGIVLVNGQVVEHGSTETAVLAYLELTRAVIETALADRTDRTGNGRLRFTAVTLHDEEDAQISSPLSGHPVRVRLHYESEYSGNPHNVDVAFKIRNGNGTVLTTFANIQTGQGRLVLYRHGYLECNWPKTTLRKGDYTCALYCAVDNEICDWMQEAFVVAIEEGDFYGTGRLVTRDHGDVLCDHDWASYSQGTVNT